MSLSQELEGLAALHQRGQLSDEEFAHAKARLLNEGPSGRPGQAHRRGSEAGLGAAVNALQRSRDERWLGGVCGGLMQISGLAAWIWRLIFIAFLFCHGTGAIVYLLLWLLVPEEPRLPPQTGWREPMDAAQP